MVEPTIAINKATEFIIMLVQFLGAGVMIFTIWISWKQYKLQQKEVVTQNQAIIDQLIILNTKFGNEKK